jgi:excisionase family DNA binding protein
MELPEHGGNNMQQILRSVKEGAAELNVSTFALYRRIKNGDIPAYRFGRKVLIDLQEVKEAMRVKTGNQHNGVK